MTAPMEHDWPPTKKLLSPEAGNHRATYRELRKRRPIGFGGSLADSHRRRPSCAPVLLAAGDPIIRVRGGSPRLGIWLLWLSVG
jgi:hypothetical protein